MARQRHSRADGDLRWTSDLPPAPGELRIVQAFVNTADLRKKSDFADPRALVDWLAHWGLVARDLELAAGDLERATALREALRSLCLANHGGAVSEAVVERLDLVAAAAALRVRFTSGGRAYFEAASDGVDGALARLCGMVAAAQLDGTWKRLKSCAEKSCRAAFYDFSRNRAAKWCSARCGSRISSLGYRHRNLAEIRKIDARTAWVRRRS